MNRVSIVVTPETPRSRLPRNASSVSPLGAVRPTPVMTIRSETAMNSAPEEGIKKNTGAPATGGSAPTAKSTNLTTFRRRGNRSTSWPSDRYRWRRVRLPRNPAENAASPLAFQERFHETLDALRRRHPRAIAQIVPGGVYVEIVILG